MKKALITGANGFIGSTLVQELLANDIEVIAVVHKHQNNIPLNVRMVECDLRDIAKLSTLVTDKDIDVFYHIAWEGSNSPEKRADAYLHLNNAKWTVDALHQAKAMGIPRFVCTGSLMEIEAEAAANKQGFNPGKTFSNGSGIYGSAKLAAHYMCVSVAAEIGIELVWTRITNIYGVGEMSKRFINTTILKIIKNEPLKFTSGTQNYDFVYIEDGARALRLIGEKGKPFCTYLIGSSCARPLREYILEMKSVLAPDREFVFGDVPFSGINLPLDIYDCSLTEKDCGFKANIAFEEGVRRTMEWLKMQ